MTGVRGIAGCLGCEKGGIAIIGAVVLPVVMGFAALAIEVGHWYLDGRVMQGAADAAAISAASSYLDGESGYVSVGQSFAATNGYQNGVNSATVTVAPINAQNQIIVDIARAETAVFFPITMRTAAPCGGVSTNLICVRAHAVVTVASSAANGNGCLIGLSRSTTGSALIVGGNGNIQAPSCVAASDTCGGAAPTQCTASGLALNGNGQVNLAELDVATQNAFACPSGGTCSIATEKTDYPLWTRDPFATFTMPAAGSCTNPQPTTANGITTYQPGVYCNGITVSGQAVVVFSPGIYFLISSNFSVSGGAINQQYVASANVVSQGNGAYKNNDTVTVSGGTAATAATLKLTVTGGKITAVTVATAGAYLNPLPGNPAAVTGGKGSGATFNLTYTNPGANGATFILTGTTPGTAQIKNAAVTLSAPTSGSTKGLVFWQDKSATSGGGTFNGNGQATTLMTITGTLYFPSQTVTISGNSVFQPTQCTAIVANVIEFQGLGSISKGCLPVSGGGSGSSGSYRLSQ